MDYPPSCSSDSDLSDPGSDDVGGQEEEEEEEEEVETEEGEGEGGRKEKGSETPRDTWKTEELVSSADDHLGLVSLVPRCGLGTRLRVSRLWIATPSTCTYMSSNSQVLIL